MTEKTLIVICIALLLLVVLLLLVLISRKPKSAQNGNDTGIDAVKEKLDKLGGVADYTNKAITSLGSMTEYRLNNMQKTVGEQLRYVAENNQRALDEIRRTVNDKLSETLESKLTESYSVIQQRLEAVYRGIGEVQSLAASVSDIKKVFSNVKLRGTWGRVGNSQISGRRFAYLATVKDTNDTSYQFGKNMDQTYGTTAIDEYAVDVTWEIADKTNIGLDMRLLNNKFNLQFDAFKESRKGIYLRRTSIPSYFGMINNPYGNIGKVENKGIEMSVSYANSWRDWSLSVMGNYSFNRNKVLEDDSTVAYPWQKTIGNKVDQRFGLIALGLFESPEEIAAAPVQVGDTRPGDSRYKDINGDGKIDEYDKVPIGWGSVPEIVYGFGFSVGWKGLSLSAMFQGAAHVDAILSGEGVLPFAQGSSRGNLLSNITDRWTEANPRQDVFYPRLSIGNMNMNYEASTWWLKNTSYLRLKNIELSYTLPDRWMKRIHINNARIFIQGVNLLTFSKFKLWDVELGDGRGAKYPNIGSVSLGINFNF